MIPPVAHNVCVPAIDVRDLTAAKEAGLERSLEQARELVSQGAHPGVGGAVHSVLGLVIEGGASQDGRDQERSEHKCQSPHPQDRRVLISSLQISSLTFLPGGTMTTAVTRRKGELPVIRASDLATFTQNFPAIGRVGNIQTNFFFQISEYRGKKYERVEFQI